MAARRLFLKWHRWKSIGFCLWPPSTCIWNLKLKFQSKLDLCSGNHVVYRQTDGRTEGRTDRWTDKVNPVYPPSNFVGRGYKNMNFIPIYHSIMWCDIIMWHDKSCYMCLWYLITPYDNWHTCIVFSDTPFQVMKLHEVTTLISKPVHSKVLFLNFHKLGEFACHRSFWID